MPLSVGRTLSPQETQALMGQSQSPQPTAVNPITPAPAIQPSSGPLKVGQTLNPQETAALLAQQPGFLGQTAQAVETNEKNTLQSGEDTRSAIEQDYADGNIGLGHALFQSAGNILGTGFGLIGGLVEPAVKEAIGEQGEQNVSNAVSGAIDWASKPLTDELAKPEVSTYQNAALIQQQSSKAYALAEQETDPVKKARLVDLAKNYSMLASKIGDSADSISNQLASSERDASGVANIGSLLIGGDEASGIAEKEVTGIAEKELTGIADHTAPGISDVPPSSPPPSNPSIIPPKAPNIISNVLDKVRSETGMGQNPNDIIGEQVRNTANNYTKPSQILSDAENVHGTNPIGVIQSYGNDIIPDLEKGKITAAGIEEPISLLENGIHELSQIKSDAVFVNDDKIPLDDFRQQALDTAQAQATKGWSINKISNAQTQINNIFDSLEEGYKANPVTANGEETPQLPLSEVDLLKTEQTGLSKAYKNQTAKPFELDAHGIVGQTAMKIVEQYADDAQVKELNKLIQSHYDAIDLLDSLVGKTPHGGRLTKILEGTGGVIAGSIIGAHFGHGLLGAAGGKAFGNFMDSVFHSDFISNPLKRLIVEQKAGKVNPAIKAKMLDYIDSRSPDISELGDQRERPLPLNKRPVKLGQPKTKAIISDMNTTKIKAKTDMDKSSAKSSKKSSKGVHNSK